jgi:hypothetical protein
LSADAKIVQPKVNGMPFYLLETIHQIAQDEKKILLLGRKVESDMINLGYFRRDVAACLRNLRLSNFRKTIRYDNPAVIFDIYQVKCHSASGASDEVYLKLKLNHRGEICIEIGSFHL